MGVGTGNGWLGMEYEIGMHNQNCLATTMTTMAKEGKIEGQWVWKIGGSSRAVVVVVVVVVVVGWEGSMECGGDDGGDFGFSCLN